MTNSAAAKAAKSSGAHEPAPLASALPLRPCGGAGTGGRRCGPAPALRSRAAEPWSCVAECRGAAGGGSPIARTLLAVPTARPLPWEERLRARPLCARAALPWRCRCCAGRDTRRCNAAGGGVRALPAEAAPTVAMASETAFVAAFSTPATLLGTDAGVLAIAAEAAEDVAATCCEASACALLMTAPACCMSCCVVEEPGSARASAGAARTPNATATTKTQARETPEIRVCFVHSGRVIRPVLIAGGARLRSGAAAWPDGRARTSPRRRRAPAA
jgi:hypothetical protein